MDISNDRVEEFDNQENLLGKWGSSGTAYGDFTSPVGIALDTKGNVYVTDAVDNRIKRFDSQDFFCLPGENLVQATGSLIILP